MNIRSALLIAIGLTVAAGCGSRKPKEPPPPPPPVATPAPVPAPPSKPAPSATAPAAPAPDAAPPKAPPPGLDPRAREGIALYDRGDYNGAIRSLSRREIVGEGNVETRVAAHKHLAFSYCLTNRTALCRQQFDALLRVDPKFALRPAEAGHPLWGPTYKQAKADADKANAKK